MKTYLFLCVLLLACTSLKAQQVVSTSGERFENSEGSITFSLGEIAIETYTGQDQIVTQGFNQTLLTVTSIWEKQSSPFEFSVYPNPTVDFVHVSCNLQNTEDLSYVLFSTDGKKILSKPINQQEFQVDFQQFDKAVYFLKIYSKAMHVKTLKIVKS